MSNTSILVLGAGELGMAVLRGLAPHADAGGASVSVLLRPGALDSHDAGKQRDIAELRSLGVGFVSGDLAEPAAALSSLFKDFHTVISCTGFVTGVGGFQIKLARAVLEAGVKRYFPWQFGVDYDAIGRGSAQDLFDEQLDVRDLLRSQSRTEWVIVSTGMFTSFLFEPSFGVVDLEQNTVRALGSWATEVTVTTPQDIGELAARICFAQPPIANRVVYTAGATVSYAQVADIVDSVLNRPVRRIEWSVPELKRELARDPDNALKKYRVVFAQGRGVSWSVDKTFNGERGLEVTGVERWAQDNLHKLQ